MTMDEKLSNIAGEEMAKEFKTHSVAEFFKKNKQMLGLVGKIRTLTTIVHEYVTNSLDACEEAKILPEIDIQIKELGSEFYEVTVKDNGPGLTQDTVGKALGQLLAGTKFHRMIQTRGQQGIGAAGCTMLSQITTGKATQVITGTGKGNPLSVEITIDPKTNQPKLTDLKELSKEFRGTMIKAKFKDVKYINSDQAPLEYLRRTAIANPHAKIKLIEPTKKTVSFKRSLKEIPRKPIEIKPHPRGVSVDDIFTLSKYTKSNKASSFLKNELDRVGDKTLQELSKAVSFDLNKDPKKLSWMEAEEIVKQFKKMTFIAPRTDGLIPIGEDRIKKSLKTIVEPEFLSVVTRKPAVYAGGFPFQVEVAIAYGGNAGRQVEKETKKVEVMRFANKCPLLFDGGSCAITKGVNSVDWKRYGIKDLDNIPLTVFVNFVSVHVPYTSAGKQAIADEEEVLEEIRLALMDCGRRTGSFIRGKRREAEKQQKRKIFMKYASEVAIGIGELIGKQPKPIETKLHDIVLKKLKLEEQNEALENNNGNDNNEQIEEEEEKPKKKTKKGKK